MAFTITFEPINRIAGTQPGSAQFDSAKDAWREVEGLIRSDEKVTIQQDGHVISSQHLKELAAREKE